MTDFPPAVLPVPAARSGQGLRVLALVLATAWLLASGFVGVSMFTGVQTDPVHLSATAPSVTSKATHNIYGGEAYTGIQNAAADTEQTVAAGANSLGIQAQGLADSTATLNRDMSNHVQQGLAVLIVGLGVLNFTVALTRYADR